ncbi:restriction endonuclease subunit R [Runella sp. CRIBMP]|uniref:Type I restriction enzyme HsdR N-terminal domain-containing protein n=1 Tax=Runella salmonicolor TaxID=2950278 RepID=A0ABT1FJH5_9BACT|nr:MULTISPECIES: type I restriction enzyme HsdR N-terminal domain-containing protein [Runella]MCP1381867.1 type I restriction enzyme HsdR N-terminal domain-containing protein [Runella salmonicolor]NBB18242.1 restriction endonuclease subunit R [Runella sp. CRIBMP]
MVQLNLPAFEYKVTKIGEKPYIFDIIRRKYVVITPEEWVRQHVLHWLMGEHRFPKALIRTESGLTYHQLAKRTDILIYDREGVPFLLVECKAPHISLNDVVFEQAIRYNSILKARYVLISNGMDYFVFEVKDGQAFLLDTIPSYAAGIE